MTDQLNIIFDISVYVY